MKGLGGNEGAPSRALLRHVLGIGMMPARGDSSNFFHQVPMRSTSPVTSLRVSEYAFPPSGPAQECR